ncbi:MAG: efflux RND transporter periplasmic adaptor subunit [Bacteroidetes bacterium]|nr:efflux RND transporter periplasmic adaptor subunit [Bacteroidota bacterium]
MKQLLLILSILLLTSCGSPEEQDAAATNTTNAPGTLTITNQERAAMDITVTDVALTKAHKTVSVPARVIEDPDHTAEVTALIEGRIGRVFARQGQRVVRDQMLATVVSMAVGDMIANLLRAESALQTTQAAAVRLRGLAVDDAASQKQLQETEHALRAAEAEGTAALQRLKAAGMTDSDLAELRTHPQSFEPVLKLRAPIAGVVSMRDASIGQPVNPGRVLFSILATDAALIEGSVFENDFPLLSDGQTATFVTAAYPDRSFSGTLSYIAPTVDNESHSLPVRCSVPNTGGLLKPNLYGRLDIRTAVRDSVLTVPQSAIVFDGSDRFLFVAVNDLEFAYRRVETGREFDKHVEILKGIAPGERVVSGGVFHLKSRYKLSLMPEEE